MHVLSCLGISYDFDACRISLFSNCIVDHASRQIAFCTLRKTGTPTKSIHTSSTPSNESLIHRKTKMTDMLPSASCPFCRIAAAYPPIPPLTFSQHKQEITGGAVFSTDTTQETHAHLVLSTTSVLAFLDIMPLTRGHVLVVTRDHYEKLGDMGVEVSREVSLVFLSSALPPFLSSFGPLTIVYPCRSASGCLSSHEL